MTRAQLKAKIEELGKLRDKAHALQLLERTLTGEVREGMEKANLERADSASFTATLIPSESVTVDVVKFRELVGARRFLECIRVDLARAKRLVDRDDLLSVSSVEVSQRLCIGPREK